MQKTTLTLGLAALLMGIGCASVMPKPATTVKKQVVAPKKVVKPKPKTGRDASSNSITSKEGSTAPGNLVTGLFGN